MGLLLMILHVAHSTPVTFVFSARLGKGVGGHTPALLFLPFFVSGPPGPQIHFEPCS